MYFRNKIFAISIFLVLILTSCKKDKPVIYLKESEYPENIGNLILTKCAVQGCHNEESKGAAGNLSLITWNKMFEGETNGAVVIPYQSNLSSLFSFCNTYSDLGLINKPTMPVNDDALSYDEIKLLKNWIDDGAHNADGYVKFSDDRFRKKYYVTNQGCDLVAVFDRNTNLIMRYINVGSSEQIESPHQVRVSPDKKNWYVNFIAGQYLEKYSTETDQLTGKVKLGDGSWNTISFTSNSQYGFVADFNGGKIVCVDLVSMTIKRVYQGGATQLFSQPHATLIDGSDDTLFVFGQSSNQYYKLEISDLNNPFPAFEGPIILDGTSNAVQPHDAVFSPDGTKYFITCQATDEVRVFDTQTHKLLAAISTGDFPQELSISKSTNYLFVTCMEDVNIYSGTKSKGVITVIDYSNFTVVKNIKAIYQPHGIAVDDEKKLVYVANRNIDVSGPAPHHTSACQGRNGKLQIISLETLEDIGNKTELSVDPYFISIR